jgi:hypothetical protein
MNVRDALVELSSAIRALSQAEAPPFSVSRTATFDAWFAFGERFFQTMIEAALLIEATGRP